VNAIVRSYLLIGAIVLGFTPNLSAGADGAAADFGATLQVLENSALTLNTPQPPNCIPEPAKQASEARYRAKSCPGYTAESFSYSFQKLTPAPETIEGVEFPRNSRMRYRAAKGFHQYSPRSVIAAAFDDPTGTVPSWEFSEFLAILLKKKEPNKKHVLNKEIETLLACNLSERDAYVYAADLTDKFLKQLPDREFIETIFDDASPRQEAFPRTVVYSSIYSSVRFFGSNILVINEKASRSMDKNFWEYKSRGRAFAKRLFSDEGQFITPGYIPSQDVVGYWQREKNPKFFATRKEGIRWALQKTKVGDETLILILDGQFSDCIAPAPDGRYFECRHESTSIREPQRPVPAPDMESEMPVIGAIRLCKTTESCRSPLGSLKKFKIVSSPNLFKTVKKALGSPNIWTGSATAFGF